MGIVDAKALHFDVVMGVQKVPQHTCGRVQLAPRMPHFGVPSGVKQWTQRTCRQVQLASKMPYFSNPTRECGVEMTSVNPSQHGVRVHRCEHWPAAKVSHFTKRNPQILQKYTTRNKEYTNVITTHNTPNYKIQHHKTPSIRILHLPKPLQKVSKSPFIFVTKQGICPSQREILQYQQITHFLFI